MLATIVVLALLLGPSALAQESKLVIDCTGSMSSTSTITVFAGFADYLQKVGPIGTVYVNGPCYGDVQIWGGDDFNIIGPAEISGNLSIGHSENAVFLHSLTITNPNGDGIDVSGSKVSLDSCDVSGNTGNGLSVDNSSHVVIVGGGSFNNNKGWAGGINVSGHSFLNIATSGPVSVQGNDHSGIRAVESDIQTNGNTTVSANGSKGGAGIYLLGGARAQIGSSLPGAINLIDGNLDGGISLVENSEISLWTCCQSAGNLVQNNSKFGISAGFHSQVTLSGALVRKNGGPGVDLYAASQLDFFPNTQNQILGNGIPLTTPSPGVRVKGNSEAWLHGGEISNDTGSLGLGNQSPGIQVGLNSSVDIASISLGNTAGGRNTGSFNSNGITCDFSSIASSDITLNFTTGCIGGGLVH